MPKRHLPSRWPKLSTNPSLRRLAQEIRKCYTRNPNGWSAVAKVYNITPGLAWRIAWQAYEPRSAKLRIQLGLPALVPTAACPRCGVVHVQKRCPNHRRVQRRDLFDYSIDELKFMLENRTEINDCQSDHTN